MNVKHKRAPDSYVKSLERKTEKAAESHKVYVCACVLCCFEGRYGLPLAVLQILTKKAIDV